MEDIKLSIINDQWEQAVRMIRNSNYSIEKVIASVAEDEFMGIEDALRLLRTALSLGYLEVNHYYEDDCEY